MTMIIHCINQNMEIKVDNHIVVTTDTDVTTNINFLMTFIQQGIFCFVATS